MYSETVFRNCISFFKIKIIRVFTKDNLKRKRNKIPKYKIIVTMGMAMMFPTMKSVGKVLK